MGSTRRKEGADLFSNEIIRIFNSSSQPLTMKTIHLLIVFIFCSLIGASQSISQLGIWLNNANFVIKYHEDIVITSTTSGILFIDVSDPTDPSTVASIGSPGSFPMAIEVSGDYAYFGGGMTGYFMVADISNMNFPVQVGITYDIEGTAYQISVSDGYAYMATNMNMFYVISISDPANPTVVSSLDLGTFACGIEAWENYVYVGTTAGLKVISVSDPSSPNVVSTFGGGYWYMDADFNNDRLFISKSAGFDVIDISNPSNPVGLFQGLSATGGGVICYQDNKVFLIEQSSVKAYGVDEDSSNLIDSYNSTITGQVVGLDVKDTVFYVSTVNAFHVLKLGVESSTSIIEADAEDDVRVYPNPFNDVLVLEQSSSESEMNVRLFDSVGKLVYRERFYGNRIELDFSGREAGLYHLQIDHDKKSISRTVVKQ